MADALPPRTLIQGHEAIIRDTPPDPKHNEYPKHMTHPAYQPGRVGAEVVSENGFKYNAPGTSVRFPPVLVMNADQEAYHASQGYVSQGKSDPAAFARAVASAPAAANHDRIEYPKWVGGVLVNSAEEEAVAAEKRRAQLGIAASEPAAEAKKPDEAGTVASSPPVPIEVEKTADQLRIEQLEARIAEMAAMMAKLMPGQAAPAPAPETAPTAVPAAAPADADGAPMTRGQRAWATRQKRAAEKAAAEQPASTEQDAA